MDNLTDEEWEILARINKYDDIYGLGIRSLLSTISSLRAELYETKIKLDREKFSGQNAFNCWQKAMDDRDLLLKEVEACGKFIYDTECSCGPEEDDTCRRCIRIIAMDALARQREGK